MVLAARSGPVRRWRADASPCVRDRRRARIRPVGRRVDPVMSWARGRRGRPVRCEWMRSTVTPASSVMPYRP